MGRIGFTVPVLGSIGSGTIPTPPELDLDPLGTHPLSVSPAAPLDPMEPLGRSGRAARSHSDNFVASAEKAKPTEIGLLGSSNVSRIIDARPDGG